MHTKRYRILDHDLTVSSDCGTFLNSFDGDYALFSAPETPADRSLSVVYLKNGGESAMLSMGNASRSLAEAPNPAILAYQMVTSMLMKQLRGFFILHGGVVAKDDYALVISGPSGSGKTTLVTALLDAGFQFLSDDFCPINMETRLVHPFPRTMWRVRKACDSTSDRIAGSPSDCTVRGGKIRVELDPLKIRIASEPCKVGAFILIHPDARDDQWCVIRVHIEQRGEKTLLGAAAGMKGIIVERLHGVSSGWEIRYRKKEGHARMAISLLKTVEPYTLSRSRVDSHNPDFLRDPSLTPLPCHEMAHLLLNELKSEHDWLRVKPGHYFMQLIEALEEVSCWRLTTGRLEKMKDLAISTFETMTPN